MTRPATDVGTESVDEFLPSLEHPHKDEIVSAYGQLCGLSRESQTGLQGELRRLKITIDPTS